MSDTTSAPEGLRLNKKVLALRLFSLSFAPGALLHTQIAKERRKKNVYLYKRFVCVYTRSCFDGSGCAPEATTTTTKFII